MSVHSHLTHVLKTISDTDTRISPRYDVKLIIIIFLALPMSHVPYTFLGLPIPLSSSIFQAVRTYSSLLLLRTVSEECVLAFTAANNKFPLWVSLSQDTFTAFSMCSLFLIIFLRKQISADSSTELTHTQNHSLKYNQNQTV